jgi:hypothetical protein
MSTWNHAIMNTPVSLPQFRWWCWQTTAAAIPYVDGEETIVVGDARNTTLS